MFIYLFIYLFIDLLFIYIYICVTANCKVRAVNVWSQGLCPRCSSFGQCLQCLRRLPINCFSMNTGDGICNTCRKRGNRQRAPNTTTSLRSTFVVHHLPLLDDATAGATTAETYVQEHAALLRTRSGDIYRLLTNALRISWYAIYSYL